LNLGGTAKIARYSDGAVIVVVRDPEALGDDERAEIAIIVERDGEMAERRANQATGAAPAPQLSRCGHDDTGASPGWVNAAIEARDEAGQTPPIVRRAFLQRRRSDGGVTFTPSTIGTLWLLEALDSPFVKGSSRAGSSVSEGQAIEAAFVFADPERARDALREGRRSVAK